MPSDCRCSKSDRYYSATFFQVLTKMIGEWQAQGLVLWRIWDYWDRTKEPFWWVDSTWWIFRIEAVMKEHLLLKNRVGWAKLMISSLGCNDQDTGNKENEDTLRKSGMKMEILFKTCYSNVDAKDLMKAPFWNALLQDLIADKIWIK